MLAFKQNPVNWIDFVSFNKADNDDAALTDGLSKSWEELILSPLELIGAW